MHSFTGYGPIRFPSMEGQIQKKRGFCNRAGTEGTLGAYVVYVGALGAYRTWPVHAELCCALMFAMMAVARTMQQIASIQFMGWSNRTIIRVTNHNGNTNISKARRTLKRKQNKHIATQDLQIGVYYIYQQHPK
ncbi:MAG: hypothetical protein HC767_13995 [Akkermansiaceae bacterium]|nr:hypothetical protein [Akkermansiaceae bacterium]